MEYRRVCIPIDLCFNTGLVPLRNIYIYVQSYRLINIDELSQMDLISRRSFALECTKTITRDESFMKNKKKGGEGGRIERT